MTQIEINDSMSEAFIKFIDLYSKLHTPTKIDDSKFSLQLRRQVAAWPYDQELYQLSTYITEENERRMLDWLHDKYFESISTGSNIFITATEAPTEPATE